MVEIIIAVTAVVLMLIVVGAGSYLTEDRELRDVVKQAARRKHITAPKFKITKIRGVGVDRGVYKYAILEKSKFYEDMSLEGYYTYVVQYFSSDTFATTHDSFQDAYDMLVKQVGVAPENVCTDRK